MRKFEIVVFLLIFVLGSISIVLSQEKPKFGPKASLKGELSVFLQAYTPRERTEADRWLPPQYGWTIQKEYEKLHPEVKIKFLEAVETDYFTWIQTRLIGGEAPHIFWGHHGWAEEWGPKGLVIAMDPYLDLPNPYIPGNKRWRDIFDPSVLAQNAAPDGKQYTINGDLVTTGIFYNKDVFDQLGLKVPKYWDEFIMVLKKIKADGKYIPMSWPGAEKEYAYSWLNRFTHYPLYKPLMKEFDVIPEEKPGVVTQKEQALAWKKGIETLTSERWKIGAQLQKEFSQYWSPGFLGLTASQAYEQFITGKAAMYLDGSWQIKPVRLDPLRKFNWGWMPFPVVTNKTTKYAPRPGTIKGLTLGGPSAAFQFNVPASAQKQGMLEVAVDFLMYLTAPKNAGPLIADLGAFLPSIKGVKPAKELEAVFWRPGTYEFLELIFPNPGYIDITEEAKDKNYKLWQLYIGDQISLDKYVEEATKNVDDAVNKLIKEHNWDFSKYGVK
ncbi:MAG: ABC transporter substrate-binding protein [bacterium]